MKNLKKLSRIELRSLNGGIVNCANIPPKDCPCNPHTTYRCNGVCIPLGQACPIGPISID
ncbi:bacteriocin-like protein [Chryseobacterium sp. SIMBA_038]|uniref:bacteriocin-like protein n=1 Tax=Chryseobacterium sp. SIMBA_038 TaxID=3085780 RepID=UPI00397BE19C